jgi:hypothetical protein
VEETLNNQKNCLAQAEGETENDPPDPEQLSGRLLPPVQPLELSVYSKEQTPYPDSTLIPDCSTLNTTRTSPDAISEHSLSNPGLLGKERISAAEAFMYSNVVGRTQPTWKLTLEDHRKVHKKSGKPTMGHKDDDIDTSHDLNDEFSEGVDTDLASWNIKKWGRAWVCRGGRVRH